MRGGLPQGDSTRIHRAHESRFDAGRIQATERADSGKPGGARGDAEVRLSFLIMSSRTKPFSSGEVRDLARSLCVAAREIPRPAGENGGLRDDKLPNILVMAINP